MEEGTIVSTLSVTIRTADEGGRYGCNSTNSRGSHAHHARLNVFGIYEIKIHKDLIKLRCSKKVYT